jgi:hypothetical protein
MNEMWTPGVSTMLQVLVSIQGLILNAKPYFNEPGYAHMSGSQSGKAQSLKYNENTFILSVRTMMYTIKRPPKVCLYSWFIPFVFLENLVYFFNIKLLYTYVNLVIYVCKFFYTIIAKYLKSSSFLGVQATDLSHFIFRILKNLLGGISTAEHTIFWRHVKRTWKVFKLGGVL